MGRWKARFEAHPFKSLALFAFVLLVALEVTLRVLNPQSLEFAYQFRQLYHYDRDNYIDFNPDSAQWLQMKDCSGNRFYNFLVTTNRFGFRCPDRELENSVAQAEPGTRYVHAIGDSMTMGWGCGYDASYPAILDSLLGRDVRVLNLGINGFGTIAATEKSRRLWSRFPATQVVYLFTTNDISDDERITRMQGQPSLYHAGMEVLDALRRRLYLVNIPLALYWHRFRAGICDPPPDPAARKIGCIGAEESFQEITTPLSASPPGPEIRAEQPNASMAALLAYAQFVKEQQARLLVVLPEAESPEARAMFAFCRQHGIEAHLLSTPNDYRMVREGHFSPFGNQRLAQYVASLLNAASR